MEIVKAQPVAITSARDKMPFEVTPFFPRLSRYGTAGAPAVSTAAAPMTTAPPPTPALQPTEGAFELIEAQAGTGRNSGLPACVYYGSDPVRDQSAVEGRTSHLESQFVIFSPKSRADFC